MWPLNLATYQHLRLWSLGFPAFLASFWSDAWTGLFVAGALRWAAVQHITFAATWVKRTTLRTVD